MKISFDPQKDAANLAKHGISLRRADELDWESAALERDGRKEYGEPRLVAVGYLESRLHVLIFTPRPDGIRAISLRKANARERRRYEHR